MMTPAQALEAAQNAGADLELDSEGKLVVLVDAPGLLAPDLKEAIGHHKDRLRAALRLREIHKQMGLSEQDVTFIEQALLAGRVSEIVVCVRPPERAQ